MTSQSLKKRRTTVRNRTAARKAIKSLIAAVCFGLSICGTLLAQDHPLKWRAAGTGSSTPAVVAAPAKLQPLAKVELGLSLNAPETNHGQVASDAPAPFVPAPAVREIAAPTNAAPSSAKHMSGWNKMKIDTDVRPASHPGDVDAFSDPFQDRMAAGARQPQSRFPRTNGGGFQAPPDFSEPPVSPIPRPEIAPELETPPLQESPQIPPESMEEPPPSPLRRPGSRFPIPTDPELENAVEPPAGRPLAPVDPPRRNPMTPRDPLGPSRDPDLDPSIIPPFSPEQGEKLQVGPEVGDVKRPQKDCDRVYNDRDCCEADEQCRRARRFIRDSSIKNISLDITPRFRPDSPTWKEDYLSRDDKLKQSDAREWKDREGGLLARGRLIDIAQNKAVVRGDNGQLRHLSFKDLSEDDVCFINAWWSLPTECVAGGVWEERNWVPSTFAWTASGLCHKPLYFEEVQLERYGHTAGPIWQPFMSGVHFFGNVLLLPYKMGINPPNECQYALGYYRPGNCAPWLLPPFPLSVRGAMAEAGIFVGGVFLIP